MSADFECATLTLTVQRAAPGKGQLRGSRYLDAFIKAPRAADLLGYGLFPNAKEVTESFAAYAAAQRHLPDIKLSDRLVTCIVVGDGSTPRTGAVFAFQSAWRCISVDPRLVETGRHGVPDKGRRGPRARPASRGWSGIDRLEVRKAKIEDVHISCNGPAVIVAVHSHASLEASIAAVSAPRIAVVALPCCVPLVVPGQSPDITYEDLDVLSPERRVKVWRDIRR